MNQVNSLKTEIKFKKTEIGHIPLDWQLQKYSDVSIINPSYKIPKGEECAFVEMAAVNSDKSEVSYFKKRIFGESGGTRFRESDVLFARITPCTDNGKIAFIKELPTEFGFGSTEFIVLSPKQDKVDPRFLFYSTKQERIRNYAVGRMKGTTGRQRVPNEVFTEELYLAIPPLPEQKKIAEILITVDEAMEKKRAIIEKTKELKKGLMQELLTRGIGHKKFKKTEIGEIPENWEVVKLKDVGIIITGSTPSTKKTEYYNGDYLWATPIDLGKNKYVNTTHKMLSSKGKEVIRNIPKGSVLVVCIGSTIGKVGMALKDMATNQQINSILCKDTWNCHFIYYWMEKISDYLFSIAGKHAVPIVNKTLFSLISIPKPPRDEQDIIGELLVSIDCKIEKESTHIDKLTTIKKSLMQELLSGRLRARI